MEIWKDIEGFNGRFSVSSEGRVKQNALTYKSSNGITYSFDEHIIEPTTWQSRYLRVDLIWKHINKRLCTYVHKLVIETFLGPRPYGMEIDHINRNYLDNRLCNLRYVTKSENMQNVDKSKYKWSEERKQKHSDRMKEIMSNPDVRAKMRKKHNMSEQGRLVLSEKCKRLNLKKTKVVTV